MKENPLVTARKKAGLSPAQLADGSAPPRQQIERLEKGERELTRAWADRLAPFIDMDPVALIFPERFGPELSSEVLLTQLCVLGEVAAGVWLESEATHLQKYKPIPVAEDPRFKGRRQFALKVLGESMNKVIAAGSYVICVLADGQKPQHDDIVVVHRRCRGLFQAALKRYRIVGGRPDLYPESSHPDFQRPLSAEATEEETSEIHSIVIGVYSPLGRE